jgi:hypothetical protein
VAIRTLEEGPDVLGRVDGARIGKRWLASWLGAGAERQMVLRIVLLDAGRDEIARRDIATIVPGRNTGFPPLAAPTRQRCWCGTEVIAEGNERVRSQVAGVRLSASPFGSRLENTPRLAHASRFHIPCGGLPWT